MRNISTYFLRLVVFLGLLASTSVYAQFQSLHQFPVMHNISSSLDAAGNLNFTKTEQLFGFRNQFAPSGVSGCVMGYPELRTLCQTVNGGFGFILPGYSSYTEFRIYIPAGTSFFGVSGYLPQSVQYAAAVKLGSAPSRISSLSFQEYETAKLSQNKNTDFGKLLAGEERIMVHDGGGSISLSGVARLSAAPMTTGQWLYVRVLNGSSIADLGALYEVDLEKYRAGYNTTQFGADGDPAAGGSIPSNPTNPTNPGTSQLTGLTLSKSEWTVGAADSAFTIRPVPSTASLPACTFSPSNVLVYSTIFPPTSAFATVSINTSAASSLATAVTDFTVSCGNQSAVFRINQLGSATTATVTEVVGADGKMSLKLKVTRPVADVTATAKSSYWVGAVIPGAALFSQEDEWFFLAQNTGGHEWKQLIIPSPASVAFALDRAITAETEEIMIPLGFSKAEFAAFRIKVHFGYQLQNGMFRSFEYIWDSTQTN